LAIATDIGCYLSEYVNKFVERFLWRGRGSAKVQVRRCNALICGATQVGFDKLNQRLLWWVSTSSTSGWGDGVRLEGFRQAQPAAALAGFDKLNQRLG